MSARKLLRVIRRYSVPAIVIITASILVFAIYFTETTLPWTAFLTGILVAAILAEAVRSARSEWMVTRQSEKIDFLKGKLKEETYLRKSADTRISLWQPRIKLLDDAIPTMIALIDSNCRCRYHNLAFREWLHMRKERIDTQHLRDVLGPRTFAEIETSILHSLEGKKVFYQRNHQSRNGKIHYLSVQHIPQFDADSHVTGFYMLLDYISPPIDQPGPGKS